MDPQPSDSFVPVVVDVAGPGSALQIHEDGGGGVLQLNHHHRGEVTPLVPSIYSQIWVRIGQGWGGVLQLNHHHQGEVTPLWFLCSTELSRDVVGLSVLSS